NGVSSAIVSLNGVDIFTERDFNQRVTLLTKTVTLRATNQLSVELRGKPGENLTLQIIGVETAPTLTSIAVTPANPSIVKGATQQFTATGTYSDSTTQNLTSQVTWSSGTPATATITPGGLATGVGTGTSVISATQGTVSGSTTLTVTAPALT